MTFLRSSIRRLASLRRIATLVVPLVAAAPAYAGEIATCREPTAFPKAQVNVVVLPYFPAGASKRPLGGLGVQLALLLKLETLYRALSYDQWGVVLLTGNKQDCDKDVITRKLIEGGRVGPGGRLIVVWGNVYLQDNDVYVQTFARAVTNSPGDTTKKPDVVVRLGSRTYTGNLGTSDFAFPPEQVTRADIAAIDSSFHKSAFLYTRPSLTALRRPLPIPNTGTCDDCARSLAFTVEGRTGNWIKVRTVEGDYGYLAARADGSSLLSRLLPEADFVHGLMGYMRYRPVSSLENTKVAAESPAVRDGMRVAEASLADYARREQSADEPESKAAALQMSGILRYALGMPDLVERFNSAYSLVPYDADARNLAALFTLRNTYLMPGQTLRPREVMNDFVAVAALDPTKPTGLANLQNFCEFMMEPAAELKIVPGTALTPAQVQSWVERVRVAASASRSP